MYNPEQKQVILRNSLGVSYHVFFEPGKGLSVRMLGDSGIWSRGYTLSGQSVNDFSVILDEEDIFHFAFQSVDGQILYGHGRHGQIEIQPVLTSRDTTPWKKHVALIRYGDGILLFYMVRFQNKYLLSAQAVQENSLQKPFAVDYVDGPGENYRVFVDRRGKCHLVYTRNDSAAKRLIHRVYNDSTGIFSAPENIVSTEHEISVSSVTVCEDRIHLLYSLSSENLYQVFCRTPDAEKPSCLYRGSSPPGYTGLLVHHGILRYYRVSADCVFTRTSVNNGESWTDEALYPFGTGASLTCFTYFTNHPGERSKIFCREIPGNFSKGYQLAFLNDHSYAEVPEVLLPLKDFDNRQETPESSFSDTKPDIRKPSGARADPAPLKDLQKKVLLLQNLTENMQRDLTKLWLAQKGIEKKLARLERFYGQLKEQIPGGEHDGDPALVDEEAFTDPVSGKIAQQNGENEYIPEEMTDDQERFRLFPEEGNQ